MAIAHDDVLTLALPYRDVLRVRRTTYRGVADAPRLVVVAGVHGDELEGLYVCHRLARWLERALAEDPSVLRGRVDLLPAVNPLGLDAVQRAVPGHEIDLNRAFPGHAEGLFAQRIAAAIVDAARDATVVVDLHASNVFLREVPQVRVAAAFAEDLVPLARTLNVDVVWVHGALGILESTVAHTLNARGVPCLVVEMGIGMRVTPDFTDQVVAGLLALCRAVGVVAPDARLPRCSHVPLIASDEQVRYVNAPTAGLFVPESGHWTTVHEGQLLGRVLSPFDGAIHAELRAPVTGVLFTLREHPLVYEGSLVARLLPTS